LSKLNCQHPRKLTDGAIKDPCLQQINIFKLTASGSQTQPKPQSVSTAQVTLGSQACREDSIRLEATTVIKVKNIATTTKRMGKECELGDQE
jgi:hypothetical protein